MRAPEKLRFGRHQLTSARFSLSRTESVPHRPDGNPGLDSIIEPECRIRQAGQIKIPIKPTPRSPQILKGHECENSRSRHTLAVYNLVVRGMQRPRKSSRDEHSGKWMPDRRHENLSRYEENVPPLIGRPHQGTYRTNPRRTPHRHSLRYQYERSVSRIRPRLSATQPDRQ